MNFNETVFVTGFPGFIAGKLIARLANPSMQFFLLVQPQFVEKAKLDIEAISIQSGTPLENFCILKGDITEENLGLSADDLAIAKSQTTSIFHLAAAYDLGIDKEIAYLVNLEGTKNVNDFAKSAQNLKRYNYVSTCYVAGNRIGKILETELVHDAGFRNYYEETKYLAEVEVENLKSELPITIFRPSVVCGDSITGETAKYDGVYYLIDYLKKSPTLLGLVNVGNTEVSMNLVPVDFVVDGLVALWKDEKVIGKTIALADTNPITTGEMCDAISLALGGSKSLVEFPKKILEKVLLLPFSPSISGLPHSGVSYFHRPQEFDTRQATEYLKKYNVSVPKFADYVGNLISFVKKHPKL
jgi:nucleoside-diphosphate-sugar epimerase